MLMSLDEFLDLQQHLNLRDDDFSRRDCIQCFVSSKTLVVDDYLNASRSQMITFVEFLEALCRLADSAFIPYPEQLQHLKVDDVVSYFKSKRRLLPSENKKLRQLGAQARHAETSPSQVLSPRMIVLSAL